MAANPDMGDEGILATSDRTSPTVDSQAFVLKCVSIVFSSISTLLAIGAFYWFVRMRRSFRHDLILLLIQSDIVKAAWLVLTPLVDFIRGGLSEDDGLCQVTGFFLTASVESADIAVLFIAIHSAAFVLQPSSSSSAVGLYPFRHWAYSIWLVLPLLMASVVPATSGKFIQSGSQCYLPQTPAWYRLALSWIPRCVIALIILVTYGWVYFYVGGRFRDFDRDELRSDIRNYGTVYETPQPTWPRGVPPTPPIVAHGLLDSAESSPDFGSSGRHYSVASTVSTLLLDKRALAPPPVYSTPTRVSRGRIVSSWEDFGFGRDASPTPLRHARRVSAYDEISPLDPTGLSSSNTRQSVATYLNSSNSFSRQSGSLWYRWCALFAGNPTRRGSGRPTIATVFRSGPPKSPGAGCTTPTTLHIAPSAMEGNVRNRERLRRQLRMMFIYPLIYMLTWVAPFVSQALGYEEGAQSQPMALAVVSTASLSIGAAVDCCFFCAWERPWQHIRGGFCEGLAMRLRIQGRREGTGKSREDRERDARQAGARREQENIEYAAEAALSKKTSSRAGRDWWDAIDIDQIPRFGDSYEIYRAGWQGRPLSQGNLKGTSMY